MSNEQQVRRRVCVRVIDEISNGWGCNMASLSAASQPGKTLKRFRWYDMPIFVPVSQGTYSACYPPWTRNLWKILFRQLSNQPESDIAASGSVTNRKPSILQPHAKEPHQEEVNCINPSLTKKDI